VLVEGEGVDPIQCWLDFDGTGWQLRQQSMTCPTWKDGEMASHGALTHNSRLTFGSAKGKAGLRLISLEKLETNHRRLQTMILTGVVLLVLGIAVYFLTR
jgi:hypothetical protein